MTVNGYKPELHSQQLVDFGDLLVGQTKTIDVELTNKMCIRDRIKAFALTGRHFCLYVNPGCTLG